MLPMQVISELPGVQQPLQRAPDPVGTQIYGATTAPPPLHDYAPQNTIARTLPDFINSIWDNQLFRILVIILVFKNIYDMVM